MLPVFHMQPRVKLAVNQSPLFPQRRDAPHWLAPHPLQPSPQEQRAPPPVCPRSTNQISHQPDTVFHKWCGGKRDACTTSSTESREPIFFVFIVLFWIFPHSYINLRKNRRFPTAAVSFRLHLTISLPTCLHPTVLGSTRHLSFKTFGNDSPQKRNVYFLTGYLNKITSFFLFSPSPPDTRMVMVSNVLAFERELHCSENHWNTLSRAALE